MNKRKVGFAVCGSFCTFTKILDVLENLCGQYDILPILSEKTSGTDTRFWKSNEFIRKIESITGKTVIDSIEEAEPIGPKGLLDVMVVAPCTGNTLAKLAQGVTDTCVTMACKAHLRNRRPVVIAVSTNDGLSGNASNIGMLMNRKNLYFVPFFQDDPIEKPTSLTADFDKIEETIEQAILGRQMQPVLCGKNI